MVWGDVDEERRQTELIINASLALQVYSILLESGRVGRKSRFDLPHCTESKAISRWPQSGKQRGTTSGAFFIVKIFTNMGQNLYYISELAQAVIRRYADFHHWNIQTWPGKISLPAKLFASMANKEMSREVSMKTYLPDGIDASLDSLIKPRAGGRQGKKRKPEPIAPSTRTPASTSGSARKRYKPTASASPTTEKRKPGRPTKTPKLQRQKQPQHAEITASERRRSGRATNKVKYDVDAPSDSEEEEVELHDDSESDVEMEDDTASKAAEEGIGKEAEKDAEENSGGEKHPAEEEQAPSPTPSPPRRGRGRPRKEAMVTVATGRPKRGRPLPKSNGADTLTSQAKGKGKVQDDGDDSSELSDPPSDIDG